MSRIQLAGNLVQLPSRVSYPQQLDIDVQSRFRSHVREGFGAQEGHPVRITVRNAMRPSLEQSVYTWHDGQKFRIAAPGGTLLLRRYTDHGLG